MGDFSFLHAILWVIVGWTATLGAVLWIFRDELCRLWKEILANAAKETKS